jgi:hypothetical protein
VVGPGHEEERVEGFIPRDGSLLLGVEERMGSEPHIYVPAQQVHAAVLLVQVPGVDAEDREPEPLAECVLLLVAAPLHLGTMGSPVELDREERHALRVGDHEVEVRLESVPEELGGQAAALDGQDLSYCCEKLQELVHAERASSG